MKWLRRISGLCLLCFLLPVSAWAEEPLESSSPVYPATTTPSKSDSERLRSLAKRLQQATIDSQNDLALLLQERETLLKVLEELETSALASERDLLSMRNSTESLQRLLTNSIHSGELALRQKKTWQVATAISVVVAVVEFLVLIL